MKSHLSNAAYGVLDYAAYPIVMLVAAPVLLKHLGVAQYGLWVVAVAAMNTGSIIASGFGDAHIQYISGVKSLGDRELMLRAVRSMIGINLVLGGALALTSWLLAPLAVDHLVGPEIGLKRTCLYSLRIASLLMLVRAMESVCMSTQRAFERYGAAVRISLVARVFALVAAMGLVLCGAGVSGIMAAGAVVMLLGTAAQLIRLRHFLGGCSLWPAFDPQATQVLLGFGAFSWMLAVSGVVFSQADRLVLGVSLGASTVTAYALCVQMAQPIYGFASSGLHFLFPYLSGRHSVGQLPAMRKAILAASAVNLLFVVMGTAAVLILGPLALRVWVGESVAQSSAAILAPIAWSFALLGLSVTGYYSLLALGRVRIVTLLNIAGGAAMLLLMGWLLPLRGIQGVAMARLCYGLITLAMYYPLFRSLRGTGEARLPKSGIHPLCEDA